MLNSANWRLWRFLWLLLMGSLEWSLYHHFSKQNLTLNKFRFALWLNSANWLFLVATFGVILIKLTIPLFHRLFDPLQVFASKIWSSSFYTPTFLLKNRVVSTKSNFNFLKSTYSLKKQVVRTTIRYINFSNFEYLQSAYFLYKPLDSLTEIQIYRIGK